MWWKKFHRWEFQWLVLLFLLLMAGWLLPTAFKRKAKIALENFNSPICYAADRARQIETYWVLRSQKKDVLIRQIVYLSRQLAYYELAHESATNGFNDTTEPQAAPALDNFEGIHGQVIRRDLKSWWQKIALWTGDQKLRPNLAVIDSRGLVGRTEHIFAKHCTVQLLTDPNFRIVASIAGDPRPVVYQGAFQSGFGQPRGVVTHVPADVTASDEHPLQLVTSGLSGVYPEAIPIGHIYKLKASSNGVFQEGEVLLDDRLLSLRESTVFIPIKILPELDAEFQDTLP